MKLTPIQVKKVLTSNNSFSQLGFNMLVTRLSGIYKRDPSDQSLDRCTDETNAFLEKYHNLMEKDFEAIGRL